MKTGIIIGRFQTPLLHEGHRMLLQRAFSENDQVVVFIGFKHGMAPTPNDPISVNARIGLVSQEIQKIQLALHENNKKSAVSFIAALPDYPSDVDWSLNLDLMIGRYVNIDDESITFYHGRDSFKSYYTGIYKDKVFVDCSDEAFPQSASAVRAAVRSKPFSMAFHLDESRDFSQRSLINLGIRIGYVQATGDAFPTAYPVVDMIIRSLDKDDGNMYVGIRKNGFDSLHFPGGFCDPTSSSNEEDASRETLEEVGVAIPVSEWLYLGSSNINDWRYKGEKHTIRSNVYLADLYAPRPLTAGDDATEAAWFSEEDMWNQLNPEHLELFKKFILKETV